MRKLIINEIIRLNKKHNDQLKIISALSDKKIALFEKRDVYTDIDLLAIYESLVRYDADMDFKEYLNKKG